MTVARALVRRLVTQRGMALPPAVAASAALHLLDAIGVGLAASASKVGRPYLAYAARVAQGGPACIFGSKVTASAADAAMINGGLIHSLEYDDTHTQSIAHGSAVLAAAALAVGQEAGATGAALLGAYARGWEVLVRIGQAAPGAFQARGFQVTSVGGTLVAALLAAELAGLDEERTLMAIGIALSQASGVFEFLSNGSSVKSLHPGWAAHAGLSAAVLAACGMTGPETTIEGRFGLFACFAGDATLSAGFAAAIENIGTRWYLLDAGFKFYPCCHYIHPFLEGAHLLRQRGVTAELIDRLICRVPAGAAPIICEPWERCLMPPTPHAARWSLPVAVAALLVEGDVGLATFEAPLSTAVLALAARISWDVLANDSFPSAFEAELDCWLTDGQIISVRVDDVYGNTSRPAAPDRIRAKFKHNAAILVGDEGAQRIDDAVDKLIMASNADTLSHALQVSVLHGSGKQTH